MFSGIIEATGRVASIEKGSDGAVLRVVAPWAPETLCVGESIATSGVCLTVRAIEAHGFAADLSGETLRRTTLGDLVEGDLLNLERSLRVGDRIGGHFVFGHVDTVGVVRVLRDTGAGFDLAVKVPADFAPYVVDKGSVAVDGISLTMCHCAADSFSVAVIPHTHRATNLALRRAGDRVNLEADMLARYARRALAFANAAA